MLALYTQNFPESCEKISQAYSGGNYFFFEKYVTSEGAVSHNDLYYQPLPITRYQERFYDSNYFE